MSSATDCNPKRAVVTDVNRLMCVNVPAIAESGLKPIIERFCEVVAAIRDDSLAKQNIKEWLGVGASAARTQISADFVDNFFMQIVLDYRFSLRQLEAWAKELSESGAAGDELAWKHCIDHHQVTFEIMQTKLERAVFFRTLAQHFAFMDKLQAKPEVQKADLESPEEKEETSSDGAYSPISSEPAYSPVCTSEPSQSPLSPSNSESVGRSEPLHSPISPPEQPYSPISSAEPANSQELGYSPASLAPVNSSVDSDEPVNIDQPSHSPVSPVHVKSPVSFNEPTNSPTYSPTNSPTNSPVNRNKSGYSPVSHVHVKSPASFNEPTNSPVNRNKSGYSPASPGYVKSPVRSYEPVISPGSSKEPMNSPGSSKEPMNSPGNVSKPVHSPVHFGTANDPTSPDMSVDSPGNLNEPGHSPVSSEHGDSPFSPPLSACSSPICHSEVESSKSLPVSPAPVSPISVSYSPYSLNKLIDDGDDSSNTQENEQVKSESTAIVPDNSGYVKDEIVPESSGNCDTLEPAQTLVLLPIRKPSSRNVKPIIFPPTAPGPRNTPTSVKEKKPRTKIVYNSDSTAKPARTPIVFDLPDAKTTTTTTKNVKRSAPLSTFNKHANMPHKRFRPAEEARDSVEQQTAASTSSNEDGEVSDQNDDKMLQLANCQAYGPEEGDSSHAPLYKFDVEPLNPFTEGAQRQDYFEDLNAFRDEHTNMKNTPHHHVGNQLCPVHKSRAALCPNYTRDLNRMANALTCSIRKCVRQHILPDFFILEVVNKFCQYFLRGNCTNYYCPKEHPSSKELCLTYKNVRQELIAECPDCYTPTLDRKPPVASRLGPQRVSVQARLSPSEDLRHMLAYRDRLRFNPPGNTLCYSVTRGERCPHGRRCKFSHGESELLGANNSY